MKMRPWEDLMLRGKGEEEARSRASYSKPCVGWRSPDNG